MLRPCEVVCEVAFSHTGTTFSQHKGPVNDGAFFMHALFIGTF